jgi:biotin transporter BioY
MPQWLWLLLAAQAGFIFGFIVSALMSMAARSRSDEEIAQPEGVGEKP